MPSTEYRGPGADGVAPDLSQLVSSVNSVLSLSLVLAQTSSPAQAMRLVTTAVPSIAASHSAVAWHPSKSGDYYQRAPENVGALLAGLVTVARLDVEGSPAGWAFPVTSPFSRERVFLIVTGSEDLSDQETFLLSVLAQLCGTVIGSQELIAAERSRLRQIAALNAELEATVSTLARVTEIHRSLTGIVASGGQAGIAATLHQLTSFPVLIVDVRGDTRATAGQVPADDLLVNREAGQWEEIIRVLGTTRRAIYRQGAWLMPAVLQADVLSVIALVDPARAATETDLAALEHAATILSVELARLHSVSEAELRGQADRERGVAEARSAVLAVSEARQRAILEAALDAVITIDKYARVTYVNGAFERTFGYRAQDVIGQDLAEKIVPPALREAHRRGLARYLETGQDTILDRRIELPAMRADGTEFPVELAVTRTGLPGEAAFTAHVRDITDRQRAEQELIASRARLVTASNAARQRITRDLHDGAQQHLVATLINLQLAEQRWESAPHRARELLGQALEDTRRGIEDLRELAAGLHPAVLTQYGLAPAVRSLADRFAIPVEIDVPGVRLPASIEASLYFFCSEALTNIVKHAQATRAWVRLEVAADRCVVEVRDDGIGGASPRSETSGLLGLSDRLGAIGGTLDITSPHSGGTVLRASVPIPPGTPPPASPQPLSQFPLGSQSFAQRRLGDLPDRVLGEHLLEVYLARHLVPGQGTTAVLDEVFQRDAAAGPERHEGHRLLAEDGIRAPDDRGFEHGGVGVKNVLDFLGVDVLPAPDDQVLDPVDQGEVAVVVEPADIARVQPATAQYLSGFLWPAQVAAHDIGSADDDLARLPGGQKLACRVDHADLDARQRQPDAARLAHTVHRVGCADDRALRQPVPLNYRNAETLLELADQLPGHRRGPADDIAQVLGVGLLAGL
jgi:PAS domain S-box-containing protein